MGGTVTGRMEPTVGGRKWRRSRASARNDGPSAAEEKGIMATDVQKLRQDLIAATADIRRKMTQKYQIEF